MGDREFKGTPVEALDLCRTELWNETRDWQRVLAMKWGQVTILPTIIEPSSARVVRYIDFFRAKRMSSRFYNCLMDGWFAHFQRAWHTAFGKYKIRYIPSYKMTPDQYHEAIQEADKLGNHKLSLALHHQACVTQAYLMVVRYGMLLYGFTGKWPHYGENTIDYLGLKIKRSRMSDDPPPAEEDVSGPGTGVEKPDEKSERIVAKKPDPEPKKKAVKRRRSERIATRKSARKGD